MKGELLQIICENEAMRVRSAASVIGLRARLSFAVLKFDAIEHADVFVRSQNVPRPRLVMWTPVRSRYCSREALLQHVCHV